MDAYEPKELPERNPVTYERHRKEVMWQILVPVLIGAVIVLALAILATTGTDAQVSKGARCFCNLVDHTFVYYCSDFSIIAWSDDICRDVVAGNSCPVTPV